MTPAEVFAMRDKLKGWLDDNMSDNTNDTAEWLIESGWVVAPPKNEGEKKVRMPENPHNYAEV